MFEPIWNRNHIDHIQITVDEKLGVGPSRQLLRRDRCAAPTWCQTICFNCCRWSRWEPPAKFDAHAVRVGEGRGTGGDPDPERGRGAAQLGARAVPAPARSATPKLTIIARPLTSSPGSTTETYAALKLTIDNWRWAGVPFYLRTAKALGVKRNRNRHQVQAGAVRDVSRYAGGPAVAELPDHFDRADRRHRAAVQTPRCRGRNINIDGVEMKFRYKDYFKTEPSTGYETLIYDCMIGDNILFQRADSVEAGCMRWQTVSSMPGRRPAPGAEGLRTRQ